MELDFEIVFFDLMVIAFLFTVFYSNMLMFNVNDRKYLKLTEVSVSDKLEEFRASKQVLTSLF